MIEYLSAEVQLKITQYTWTEEYFPGFVEYDVSMSLDDKIFNGRGIAEEKSIAISKATAECLEDLVLHTVNKSRGGEGRISTSSGFAAHYNQEAAIQHGLQELLERDSFMCHFLSGKPFVKLRADNANFPSSRQFPLFEKTPVQYFSADTALDGYSTIICSIDLDSVGLGRVIGLATSRSLHDAGNKAFLEAARRAAVFLIEDSVKPKPAILEKINLNERLGPDEHYALSLNKNYWDNLNYLFPTGAAATTGISSKQISLKVTTDFDRTINFLKDCPLKVVHCKSSDLQNFYFGGVDRSKINFQRLKQFYGKSIEYSEVNKSLHPIG